VSPILDGVIGMSCFFVLSMLGVPIGFSLIAIGFAGLVIFKGIAASLYLFGNAPYALAASYSFSVFPLFVLMGQFAYHSGIGRDLYVAAYRWLGKLPGGLALATMLACTGFAACTGSTVASAATMGTLAFPEMERFRYSRRLSTAVIATGGTLGTLIPPSSGFIIYGILTQTSIGSLFIAGILPGLLLSALYLGLIYVLCVRNPDLGPRGEDFSWPEKVRSLKGVWGMLILFALIIGGLYLGIFSPNEAGASGALGAFLIALFRKRLNRKTIYDALISSTQTTCFVMFIIIGAMMFNYFLASCGFGIAFGEWVKGLPFSRWIILIVILLLYIPLGAFMDSLSIILLTLPFIFPIITDLGFDPIWFGVLIVVELEMGVLTPPVGLNAYVVHGITKVPLKDIFIGLIPFMITMCIGMAILVAFPQISTFLPALMK
jgi:C4-dicarboxylate transporter, DctM subunit